MATILSLDPRVTRMNLDAEQSAPAEPKPALDQFQTFEVFHQVKTGAHHTHVGCVHAPSPELALLLARRVAPEEALMARGAAGEEPRGN